MKHLILVLSLFLFTCGNSPASDAAGDSEFMDKLQKLPTTAKHVPGIHNFHDFQKLHDGEGCERTHSIVDGKEVYRCTHTENVSNGFEVWTWAAIAENDTFKMAMTQIEIIPTNGDIVEVRFQASMGWMQRCIDILGKDGVMENYYNDPKDPEKITSLAIGWGLQYGYFFQASYMEDKVLFTLKQL